MYENLATLHQTSAWHTLLCQNFPPPLPHSRLTYATVTFSAASILLAASLCPELEVDLEIGAAKTSWQRAFQIFEFHKPHVESAEKGIEALLRYRQQFGTGVAQGKQQILNRALIYMYLISFLGTVAPPVVEDDLQTGLESSNIASDIDETWLTEMTQDFTSDLLDESWLSSQMIDWTPWQCDK